MNKHDYQILREFAEALRKKLPDASIWGFGSRVRGDASEESDLDVCVVVSHLSQAAKSVILETAWETSFEHNIVITTVKYERDAFEYGPCSKSPLVHQILTEGVAA